MFLLSFSDSDIMAFEWVAGPAGRQWSAEPLWPGVPLRRRTAGTCDVGVPRLILGSLSILHDGSCRDGAGAMGGAMPDSAWPPADGGPSAAGLMEVLPGSCSAYRNKRMASLEALAGRGHPGDFSGTFRWVSREVPDSAERGEHAGQGPHPQHSMMLTASPPRAVSLYLMFMRPLVRGNFLPARS
ncbi:hypothetical protein BX264_1014 [Streptomyces sp. 2333.5]|nr:hypothetical protein BX264_1014 [Streptomyces sp. 2333.5]